ncbi:hypothetical protein ACFZAM_31370 [Streptomyces sp. NPDC008079]|uniref:hypothetical protein n=1 Tax=Streptomyces sp. NPDC008079 TaxID=3364806 RepID=UPI0036E3D3CA
MRAHFSRTVTDGAGNVVEQQMSVRVLVPGTVAPIGSILYADGTSGTTLTNPWTVVTGGRVNFYLDQPQRVRLGITVTGGLEEFVDDVDVLAAATDSTHPGAGTDSVQVGLNAAAAGSASLAAGVEATASGNHALAIGHQTSAVDDQAVAIGEQAAATQPGAMAIGASTEAAGSQATAIGTAASATYDQSTALGSGARTTRDHQVVLGTSGDLVEVPGSYVLTSPTGNRYMITVTDDGQLMTQGLPALETFGGPAN